MASYTSKINDSFTVQHDHFKFNLIGTLRLSYTNCSLGRTILLNEWVIEREIHFFFLILFLKNNKNTHI